MAIAVCKQIRVYSQQRLIDAKLRDIKSVCSSQIANSRIGSRGEMGTISQFCWDKGIIQEQARLDDEFGDEYSLNTRSA